MSLEQRPPFPKNQLFQKEGEFEHYLLSFPDLELPFIDYDNPPAGFTSVGVDVYLNWLGALMKHYKKEPGAFIHLQINPRRLIYPSNPTMGTKGSTTVLASKNIEKFFPLIRTHAHPDLSCFSPEDLGRFMCVKFAFCEGLSTPTANYLLIRTNQTTQDEPEQAESKILGIRKILQKRRWDRRKSNLRLPEEIPVDDHALLEECIFTRGQKRFGIDHLSYYRTFLVTNLVANIYKLVLYTSKKDGCYTRFSMAETVKQIEDVIKEGCALYFALKDDPQNAELYQRLKDTTYR